MGVFLTKTARNVKLGGLVGWPDAELPQPSASSGSHPGTTRRTGGPPFGFCRIRAGSASSAAPQSRSQTRAKSASRRSDHYGIVYAFNLQHVSFVPLSL